VDGELIVVALSHAAVSSARRAGNVTEKVLPPPGSLTAVTEPPCASATRFTMASPSPVPPVARPRDGSTR